MNSFKLIVVLYSILFLAAGCGKNTASDAIVSIQGTSEFSSKAIGQINKLDWEHKSEGGLLSTPVLGVTALYYGNDEKFYAINKETGKEIWSKDVESQVSSAAETEGIVCFTDEDQLYALQAKDGKVLWTREFQTSKQIPERMTTVVVDGIVILVEKGVLYGIDVKTGKEKWTNSEAKFSIINGTPYYNGHIFVGVGKEILEIDLKSGKVINTIAHNKELVNPSLLIAKDFLVVVDSLGDITTYDLKSGKSKWTYSKKPSIGAAYSNGVIYTSNLIDGYIYAIELETGSTLWEKKVANSELSKISISASGKIEMKKNSKSQLEMIMTFMSIADGNIYLGTWNQSQGEITSVDAKTGDVLWSYRPDKAITTQPLIHNQKLYAINSDQRLVAFSGQKKDEGVNRTDPKDSGKLSIDELSVHGLKLGASTDDVVKSLGMPQDKQTDTSLNSTIYKYKNLELLFTAGKLAAIKSNDKEYQTKQGVRPSSLLEELLKAYNGYEGYFGKKLAMIKGENTLLIFNLGRFFDNDPYSVGSMSIINIKSALDNPKSAEGYYLANLMQQEGAIASLIDSGFAIIDSTSIESVTDKVSFGDQAEKIKPKEVAVKSPEPNKAESNASSNIKEFEGQWSTPGSDELAFKLAFKSDTKGTITFFLSEGEKSTSNIEIVYDNKQLIYNYEGANRITVLKLINSKTMIFEGYDGKQITLEKVKD